MRPLPASGQAALITGTSSEFLGARPLPRVLARPVIWVLGPSGAGRSSVARRLAGPGATVLDGKALHAALAEQVARGAWSPALCEVPALVLDGPSWLRGRPGVAASLARLLLRRLEHGHKTLVVQSDEDPSLEVVLEAFSPELVAVVGLRFPAGERGRRRAVRRLCAELGLPAEAGRGLAQLEPWSYARVREALSAR